MSCGTITATSNIAFIHIMYINSIARIGLLLYCMRRLYIYIYKPLSILEYISKLNSTPNYCKSCPCVGVSSLHAGACIVCIIYDTSWANIRVLFHPDCWRVTVHQLSISLFLDTLLITNL